MIQQALVKMKNMVQVQVQVQRANTEAAGMFLHGHVEV